MFIIAFERVIATKKNSVSVSRRNVCVFAVLHSNMQRKENRK